MRGITDEEEETNKGIQRQGNIIKKIKETGIDEKNAKKRYQREDSEER